MGGRWTKGETEGANAPIRIDKHDHLFEPTVFSLFNAHSIFNALLINAFLGKLLTIEY